MFERPLGPCKLAAEPPPTAPLRARSAGPPRCLRAPARPPGRVYMYLSHGGIHAYMYVHVHIYVDICVGICIHTHITHIYIYIYVHTS